MILNSTTSLSNLHKLAHSLQLNYILTKHTSIKFLFVMNIVLLEKIAKKYDAK